jgi:hypothetical protein
VRFAADARDAKVFSSQPGSDAACLADFSGPPGPPRTRSLFRTRVANGASPKRSPVRSWASTRSTRDSNLKHGRCEIDGDVRSPLRPFPDAERARYGPISTSGGSQVRFSVFCGPRERTYDSKAVRVVPMKRSVWPSRRCAPWKSLLEHIEDGPTTDRSLTAERDRSRPEPSTSERDAGATARFVNRSRLARLASDRSPDGHGRRAPHPPGLALRTLTLPTLDV